MAGVREDMKINSREEYRTAVYNQDKQAPLISVIIPVYNDVAYLREALDSVIRQTYENLQIILVDDGSKDGSGAVCDEYKADPRVTVFHQTHRNVSYARNAGLELVTGEYTAFLDSDDAYDPSFMLTMLEAMLRENADIVICRYYAIEAGNEIRLGEKPAAKHDIFPFIKSGSYNRKQALLALLNEDMHPVIWNKFYKSELWKNTRFPVEFDVSEDLIALYDVFDLCNKVSVIDQPLYFYRKQSGTLSKSYTEKYIQDRILAHSYLVKYVEAHVPEIFSKESLVRCKQAPLNLLISQFAYVKDPVIIKGMKDKAIALADQIGIANCGIRTRAGYRLVRYCPWLFRALYQIYYPIRLWIRKIRG